MLCLKHTCTLAQKKQTSATCNLGRGGSKKLMHTIHYSILIFGGSVWQENLANDFVIPHFLTWARIFQWLICRIHSPTNCLYHTVHTWSKNLNITANYCNREATVFKWWHIQLTTVAPPSTNALWSSTIIGLLSYIGCIVSHIGIGWIIKAADTDISNYFTVCTKWCLHCTELLFFCITVINAQMYIRVVAL